MSRKACVVTGASRGMGRGIALVLAKEAGCRVYATARDKEALNNPLSIERQLVKEISDGQGSKIKTIRNPVLINKKPIRIDNLSPELGQHSFEILNEVGVDKNAFSKLVSDGITI